MPLYQIQRYSKVLDTWFGFDARYTSEYAAQRRLPILMQAGFCPPGDLKIVAVKK